MHPAAATVALPEESLARLHALVQELRVPITPVKMQLDLLAAEPLRPEQRASVGMLRRNCERYAGLVEELERELAALR